MKKVLHIFTNSSNNIGDISTMMESYIHGVEGFSNQIYLFYHHIMKVFLLSLWRLSQWDVQL